MSKDGNSKLNNAGYSLVELIVIMGIIAAIIGVLSLSVSLIFSKDAEYTARTIDDELSDVRSLAMSLAGDFEYVLHVDATNPKGCYIEINVTQPGGTVVQRDKFELKKGVIITATNATGTSIIDGSGNITFSFDKANGKVKTINGAAATSGDIYTIHIVAAKNSAKTEDVIVVPATGRHYIK